jgi:hypothetical protein
LVIFSARPNWAFLVSGQHSIVSRAHTLFLATCEKINLTKSALSANFSDKSCVKDSMDNYFNLVSGWLTASGSSLLDTLPSGSGICRVVPVEPANYWTGYVSTAGGSFKSHGESGNWYGTSFGVALAERPLSGPTIYEYSCLGQDTPVWNMNKLPEEFRETIYADRNLATGQYLKSQFVIECLNSLSITGNASGIYFPSRRIDGGVVVLNPQLVNLQIISTGQSPPTE